MDAFDGWLGQSGWKVRVGVMQFEDEGADLDIFITERAWTSREPPVSVRISKAVFGCRADYGLPYKQSMDDSP